MMDINELKVPQKVTKLQKLEIPVDVDKATELEEDVGSKETRTWRTFLHWYFLVVWQLKLGLTKALFLNMSSKFFGKSTRLCLKCQPSTV